MNASALLAVFVGAGLGGTGRYALGLLLPQPAWLPMAVGTLAVNLLGGFLAGVLYAALGPAWLKSQPLGLFMMTGVLGGLTTFSAFTAEGAMLLAERPLLSALQAAVHVLGCLLAFWLGSKVWIS
ncbi:MAG TPA: CrcB family protein [Limnobacter sp.]|nr:CrcB family protein [Limnobacter sp.]